MKRIAALFLIGFMLIGSLTIDAYVYHADQLSDEKIVISETDNLQMSVGKDTEEIMIFNRAAQKEYTTAVSEQELEGVKGVMLLKLQSLVTGSYYDLELKKETDFYTASDDVSSVRKIKDDSVEIKYTLDKGLEFTVEAVLEGEEFLIRIPEDSLVETERFVFKEFQIAPNFFSAAASQEGYMLIPDGSGALIEFNNGKSGLYDEAVYGNNKAFIYEAYAVSEETIHLPVFGLERDGANALAVISQGASMARVRAATNGNETTRNRVYASFVLREEDAQYITEDAFQTVIQEKLDIGSDLELTYMFGTKGEGYSEMAELLREYMQMQGMEAEKQDGCVLLSIYGAVSTKQKIFGVPLYDKVGQITSYEAAKEMIGFITSNLSTSPTIRLAAWDADTVMGYSVNSFHPIGSKKQLKELLAFCKEKDAEVYLSEPFAIVRKQGKGIIRN